MKLTLADAQRILGPIRMYYSERNNRWYLDQRQSTKQQCIEEAMRRLREISQK